MEIRRIDPRTSRWEDHYPTYRVYFWGKAASSYEFELSGATDVYEVVEWAKENAGADRTFTIYAVGRRGDSVGQIRLLGTDPTRKASG
jgi:hypothetical protein